MINFYKKHELIFSIVMIAVYSFLQSLAIEGNVSMGVEYSIILISWGKVPETQVDVETIMSLGELL